MNNDLKNIQKWRNLTESILNESLNKWIIFIGEDDKLSEGEKARMLAYLSNDGEEDIISDMNKDEILRLQNTISNEDRKTKQIDVTFEDDEYIANENVIFAKTI